MTPEDLLRVAAQAETMLADDTFAAEFYQRLFSAHPELRALFPTDPQVQQRKFSSELAALVGALRNLDAFESRGRVLGERHQGYGVRAGHYAIVRDALLTSVAARLGPGFTDADRLAWARAYNLVAEVMQEGARAAAAHARGPATQAPPAAEVE